MSASLPTTIKRPTAAEITTAGNKLPNRYVLHGVEGLGKTSWAAQAPKVVFIQTRGETGLETLIDAGQLPPVAHFPGSTDTWPELLGCIQALIDDPHDYRTLAIDTINGGERLCHEHVCRRDFKNEWGDGGFMGYQRGFKVSNTDWLELLALLDKLRMQRKMTILLLCHTKVSPFRNPEGPDFDRFTPDVHPETWGLTHKWADCVLFGNFSVTVEGGDSKRKGKGTGGQIRLLFTQNHASYTAKNRLGLPPEIEMGETPAEGWRNFMEAIKSGRKITEVADGQQA